MIRPIVIALAILGAAACSGSIGDTDDAAGDTEQDTTLDTVQDPLSDTAPDAVPDTAIDTEADTTPDASADTTLDTAIDTAVDTDVDTAIDLPADDGPACTSLTSGRWTGSGPAFGMSMAVTLTMTDASCSFTLTAWSMSHGSMPDGGAISGSTVTLSSSADPGYWSTCTGPASSSTHVTGVCSSDSAAFTLSL